MKGCLQYYHFYDDDDDGAPLRSLSAVDFGQWKVICQDSTLHSVIVEYCFG